jgi:aspartyl-tRNA(Asn)/glutamyl-tRNA(Gln) amidotransferase subunit C
MDKDKVLGLAKLARISITEEEAENLSHEFEGILNYVGEIKKAEGEDLLLSPKNFPLRNVFREDSNPNKSGEYTKDILKNAPKTDGDYIKVKNIL